jgi:hypothetical protein
MMMMTIIIMIMLLYTYLGEIDDCLCIMESLCGEKEDSRMKDSLGGENDDCLSVYMPGCGGENDDCLSVYIPGCGGGDGDVDCPRRCPARDPVAVLYWRSKRAFCSWFLSCRCNDRNGNEAMTTTV